MPFTQQEKAHPTGDKTRRSAKKPFLQQSDEARLPANGSHKYFGATTHIPKERNSDMPANVKLSEIAMLGSHDAGTYAYDRGGSIGSFIKGLFRTQKLDLAEQAQAGVQYFDIRPASKKFSSYQYEFFHGPSNTTGDALSDIYALLDHAAQDPGSLYILKFHFKEKDKVENKNVFLSRITDKLIGKLIAPSDFSNRKLGDITVGESIHAGKNIAILAKETKGVHENLKGHFWDYSSNVHTKWGNSLSGQKMASHIESFSKTNSNGNIVVTQTNMPGISLKKPPFLSRGLEHLAESNHATVANAVENIIISGRKPGAISADFIGHSSASSTDKYNLLVEIRNAIIKNHYGPRRASLP
jgi:hypothetical protein